MADIPQLSKHERLEHPSGWLYLTQNESVHYIIDALLSVDPKREFTQTELAHFSGLSTQSVRRHIDRLVELNVVAKRGRRYHFNAESDVGRLIMELNGALVATGLDSDDAEDRSEADAVR